MTGKNGSSKNNFHQPTTSNIFLVDSLVDINKLIRMIQQRSGIIISLDYATHKILSQKNIQHEISDIYSSDNELKYIQQKSRDLSYWFKESTINNFLNYKNVNMGQLFYPELHYFLVSFLKNYYELSKIFDTYSTYEFFVGAKFFAIINSFTDKVTKLENINKQTNVYLYDSVKFTLRLGKKNYSIPIPKRYYQQIKNMFEFTLSNILNKSDNSFFKMKSVLLVEFDTIRYSKLISTLSTSLNLISYNRRRPSFWNLKSFFILKKSKIRIITSKYLDKSLRNEINYGIKNVKNQIESLWLQEDFFKEFFSLEKRSFWIFLKPFFVELSEKRMIESVNEIELAIRMLNKYNFRSILILSEHGFTEQIILQLAKVKKIPVFLLQHGVYYDTPESHEQNKFAGVLPMSSDLILVWGKIFENYLKNCGYDNKKFEVLGSAIYDEIFDRKKNYSNLRNDTVLLSLAYPPKNQITDLTIKTLENYELAIKRICQDVLKIKKKLIIKLHPYSEQEDITQLVRDIDPSISIIKKGNIIDLIDKCGIFVTLNMSTTILEAQILEKPVISIQISDYGIGEPTIFSSNSCLLTSLDNFEILLRRLLDDKTFRKNIIDNGNYFVNNYLSNHGKASQSILSFLIDRL